jgi:putative Mg2+ transporter-C (MgtC) family protein
MLVGIVIGLEREFTHRPAGLRTHILVALGACVASVMGEMIFMNMTANADPARLSAQVITGVGFLGAGTIMREGASVKGLTTAASLWAVACLGIAAGGGYYTVALPGMVFVLITLTVLEALQKLLLRSQRGKQEYKVTATDAVAALQLINRLSDTHGAQLKNIQAEHLDTDRSCLQFSADFGRGNQKKRIRQFMEDLAADPAILSVSTMEEANAKETAVK